MKTAILSVAVLGCFLAASNSAHAFTQGKLMSGESIGLGQAIAFGSQYGSSGGGHLILQRSDGNLVLYINNFNSSHGAAIYSPQTQGQGGIMASMLPSGDFVVTTGYPNFRTLFHTNTGAYPGAHLEIRDDHLYNGAYTADLVVVNTSGAIVWRASANDSGHYYSKNINRPSCSGGYCPSNPNDWTSILKFDGGGHDRPGYDLDNMPITVATENLCAYSCLERDASILADPLTAPAFNTASCVAWAFDSASSNCWLKHVTCDTYSCYVPPLTSSSNSESSGYIDPVGWGIVY
jgi:hypothetical protein